MKKLIRALCVLLFVLHVPLSVMAAAIATNAVPPASSEERQQIQLLKAQAETVQGYQDQFISIVQWSLGAVLAMALGLAAFNWYSSKVSYERDIQSLRQENKALHAELTALLKTETDAASKRLSGELSARQLNIEGAVAKTLEPRLASLASQLLDQKKKLLELRYELTEREAEEAVKENSYAWAIYKYCELLDLSVKQGSDFYQVGEILDNIRGLLDNPATALTADNVTGAVEALKRLPPKYQPAAENIIPRIQKAHK